MVESTTTRLGLRRWSAGTDGPSRDEFDSSFANLEARAAIYLEGTRAARPAAGAGGRFYTVKGDAALLNGTQYYDNGTTWVVVGATLEDQVVRASAVGTVPHTVRKIAGQTTDLTQWMDENGVLLGRFTNNGRMEARAQTSGITPLVARAAAGQTADLQQFQDSAGTVIARVDSDGDFLKGNDMSALLAAVQTLSNKTLASPAFTGTPTGLTKAHVGLGSVDNTSDAAKPISSAQATVNTDRNNRLNVLESDSGYIACAIQPGWQLTAGAVGGAHCSVRRVGQYIEFLCYSVTATGAINVSTTGNVADNVFAILPSGFWPSRSNHIFAGRFSNRTCTVVLDPANGHAVLTASDGTGTAYSIPSGDALAASAVFLGS